MKRLVWSSTLSLLVVGFSACTNGAGPNGLLGRVHFAVSAQQPAGAAGAAALLSGDSTVLVAGDDTLILRGVDVVLRRIELKPVSDTACEGDGGDGGDGGSGHDASPADDSAGHGDDGCAEVESGPVLVSLPLGAAATDPMVDIAAPAGSYNRVEFSIHAPKPPADTAFLTANPDFDGVSVRVTGTFSHAGTRGDFTFRSALEARQEAAIDPPIDVASGGTANITVRFDVSGWFLNGAALVDPATANAGGPNEALVRENIERSVNAFRDDDHDGHDDMNPSDEHDGSGGGGGQNHG
jgi:hypothetical protein